MVGLRYLEGRHNVSGQFCFFVWVLEPLETTLVARQPANGSKKPSPSLGPAFSLGLSCPAYLCFLSLYLITNLRFLAVISYWYQLASKSTIGPLNTLGSAGLGWHKKACDRQLCLFQAIVPGLLLPASSAPASPYCLFFQDPSSPSPSMGGEDGAPRLMHILSRTTQGCGLTGPLGRGKQTGGLT